MSIMVITSCILVYRYEKPDAILFFNNYRSEFGNLFFKGVTLLGEAYVYVLLSVLLLFYSLRYSLVVACTGILVLVLSPLTKMYFASERPLTWFKLMEMEDKLNLIDGVDLHTGATSFPSGHTMAAFALYSVVLFILPVKQKLFWTFSLFSIAVLVGISRIYLVQHFLEDVLAGSIIGVALATGVHLFQVRYPIDCRRRIDRPLFFR